MIERGAASNPTAAVAELALTWTVILIVSITTDMLVTKRRAAAVGKQVFSKLGTHMAGAAAPGFTAGFLLTMFFVTHGRVHEIWPYWMLAYGLAICSVGQFSVRPVSFLGWAFVLAGALSLFLPQSYALAMMAIAFGGFHIIYGIYTGVARGDW